MQDGVVAPQRGTKPVSKVQDGILSFETHTTTIVAVAGRRTWKHSGSDVDAAEHDDEHGHDRSAVYRRGDAPDAAGPLRC